jgi:hypothetical protein
MLNNMELPYFVPMMVVWGTEVLCTKDCSDVLFFHSKVHVQRTVYNLLLLLTSYAHRDNVPK